MGKKRNKILLEALVEVRAFLNHIQPKIGEQAFNHIYSVVDKVIKEK